MKIFNVNFKGHWPVPHGLIIAANNEDQAKEFAFQLLTEEGLDPDTMEITEILLTDLPQVLFFESGTY